MSEYDPLSSGTGYVAASDYGIFEKSRCEQDSGNAPAAEGGGYPQAEGVADYRKKNQQPEDALASRLDNIQKIQTEPRRIAWIRNNLSISSYLDLEPSIHQLVKHQKDAIVFLGKVGVGIAREHLEKKQYDSYDMVFLILDPEDSYEGNTDKLPEEICLSVRFCGSHQEAPVYYKKLDEFMSIHGLKINGFSREITMIDYGFTGDTSQFVTEIQIPVVGG